MAQFSPSLNFLNLSQTKEEKGSHLFSPLTTDYQKTTFSSWQEKVGSYIRVFPITPFNGATIVKKSF
jgi:hypothetical protein